MKTTKKLSAHGFSAVEGLLVLIIIGLVGFVGWYVWHNRAKTVTNSSAPLATERVNNPPKTSKPAEIEKLTKYCDPIEKSCISYDSTWIKKASAYKDEVNHLDRTDIELSSKTYAGLKVSFKPYVYGVGGGCLPAEVVDVVKIDSASGQNLVESYSDLQDVRNSKPIGPHKYYIGMSIDMLDSSKSLKAGSHTDCIGLGLYSNPNKKDTFGGLSVSPSKQPFSTTTEAKAWFSSGEAKAALKVLKTLEL